MQLLSLALAAVIARLGRQNGQTMAEYGILIAVIAIVVVVAAVTLGSSISGSFTSSSHRL